VTRPAFREQPRTAVGCGEASVQEARPVEARDHGGEPRDTSRSGASDPRFLQGGGGV